MSSAAFSVLFGTTCIFVLVNCVYFNQKQLNYTLPWDFPSQTPFAQLALLESISDRGVRNWHFTLQDPGNGIPVQLQPNRGTLSLKNSPNDKNLQVTFNVHATLGKHDHNSNVSSSTIQVTLRFDNRPSDTWCESPPKEACFLSSAKLVLRVMENDPPQVISRPGFLGYKAICPRNSVGYTISPSNESLQIDPATGEIRTREALDREAVVNPEFGFTINCSVSFGNGNVSSQIRSGDVTIGGVNDNGPRLVNGDSIYKELDKELTAGSILDLSSNIIIRDADLERSNYSVELMGDSLDFFNISFKPLPFSRAAYYKADLVVKKPLVFPGESYRFSLVFVDNDMLPNNGSNQTVLNIAIHNKTTTTEIYHQYDIDVHPESTIYTRVLGPFHKHLGKPTHIRFSLEDPESEIKTLVDNPFSANKLFGVTPTQGIVYVNHPGLLNEVPPNHVIRVKLRWKSDSVPSLNNFTYINITVGENKQDGLESRNESCTFSNTCGKHTDNITCTRSCGVGIIDGSCHWISKKQHSTCVADVMSCRDGECDELEKLHWSICPQDCTDTVIPKSYKAENQKGIINDAIGTCSCDSSNHKCQCFNGPFNKNPPDEIATGNIDYSTFNSDHKNRTNDYVSRGSNGREDSVQHTPVVSADEQVCGTSCYALIIFGALLVVIILVTMAVIWRMRTRRKIRSGKPKYLGSAMSLSAVPSDYVDERSSSIVSQTITVNEPLVTGSIKLYIPIDRRWEIPRSHLIIEQTIGEGEFGKVMRAKAFGIGGVPGFSTVAVKTLKNNGTSTELQDLLSEYNLLKEVAHPNVIKLLGACTSKDGPMSIIVEYAEHGSLRSFLRKSRQLEFATYASEDSGVGSLFFVSASGTPLNREYQVSPRDLLSFMWQISKGMTYLSEMKLVHRDLATRNILVASGRVIKISDFGLSRDVYEGDTYFKTSKGRVPVKWMALESLINHVYTSKSDVWSFGVVMWEIAMLGATPYPGIPPERLFYLLRTGYRMEKPENCSDDLYMIMRHCWRENPHERPTFKELMSKFDSMLQENVEYLDLSLNIIHNMTYFESQAIKNDDEDDDSDLHYGSLNVLPTEDEYLSRKRPENYENTCLLSLMTEKQQESRSTEAEAIV